MTQQYNSYGRDQINIENIHLASSISGEELLNRGLQFLNQRAYPQAINVLSDATKLSPSISDAHYYLAIALLNGKKPKKLDGLTIQRIEENLNIAVNINADSSKCYILWAIVKNGYYTMNGFIEQPPTSAQLFRRGDLIQTEQAREIFFHLNDSTNEYWMKLYNKFEKNK